MIVRRYFSIFTVFFLTLTALTSNLYAQSQAETKFLSLTESMKKMDAKLLWDPFFQTGVITSGGHNAVFTVEERSTQTLLLYDNKILYRVPTPLLNDDGQLLFSEVFVNSLAARFKASINEDNSRFRIAAIVVDPGHGGKDPGAFSNHTINGKKIKVQEKDIALDVSNALYKKLQKAYPDKRIISTRLGDTFPELKERVAKANAINLKENEAIIYVSVHANAGLSRNARGYEVWYSSPEDRQDVIDKKKSNESEALASIHNDLLKQQFTTESVLIAQSILDQFNKTFDKSFPNRGLKDKDWYVVSKARMPAVLVELGFITNTEDTKLMLTSTNKFADAIYNGIAGFVTRFENSSGFTQVAAK
ncbi:N-acetylmuramoyl-L-alanine amidase [Spirochaetia bacterium]|nr:N-acetylmuramoyl-L-alanine amidase [Spirochaetia bacterium]